MGERRIALAAALAAIATACGGSTRIDNASGGTGGSGTSGSTGSGCIECVPGCPTTPPTDGDACSLVDQSCNYATSNACETIVATCGADLIWHAQTVAPGCASACPATPPNNDDACGGSGCCGTPSTCMYPDGACGQTITAQCVSGKWQIDTPSCSAPDCSMYVTSGECVAAGGCRWLEPGCPTGVPVVAGCYPSTDCMTGCTDPTGCCPTGKTCQLVDFDPCYAGDCAVCSTTTYACQ